MRSDKRGISAIVATVLIILITVAAVTIIWAAIIPMIQDNASFDDPNTRLEVTTQGGYTFYDTETKVLWVQVKRGADSEKIAYIEFIVSVGGNSIPFAWEDADTNTRFQAPAINAMKTYYLNLSGQIVDEIPESVMVVPFFDRGGKVVRGTIVSELDNIKGTIASSEPSSEPSSPSNSDGTNPDGGTPGGDDSSTGCEDKDEGDICYDDGTCNVRGTCVYTEGSSGTGVVLAGNLYYPSGNYFTTPEMFSWGLNLMVYGDKYNLNDKFIYIQDWDYSDCINQTGCSEIIYSNYLNYEQNRLLDLGNNKPEILTSSPVPSSYGGSCDVSENRWAVYYSMDDCLYDNGLY